MSVFDQYTDVLFAGSPGSGISPILPRSEGTLLEQTRAYYTSIGAYAPFDHTRDGRTMLGCMDPRGDDLDKVQGIYVARDRQMTKIQGPGGELGEGEDQADARTVETGQLVTVGQGIQEDMALRRASVLGAHLSVCAFARGFGLVVAEQAQPSEQTSAYLQRWMQHHELDGFLDTDDFKAVMGAAALRLERVQAGASIEPLIEVVDKAYPDHHNVPEMKGDGSPGFYLVNNFPHLGLNRHHKHEERRLNIQAYHDNVGARLDNVHNLHALPHDVRAWRMAALLLRSAATRTVIDRLKREAGNPVEHWDVEIGDNGPRFVKIS